MPKRLLIANRGEIAIRIARTAADLGVGTVAVHAEDDAASLHVRAADEAVNLGRTGVPAYLDIEGMVAAAKAKGCDAVHPGYGFLSENAGFAEACEAAGLTFVGPGPTAFASSATRPQRGPWRSRAASPCSPGSAGRSPSGRRRTSWPAWARAAPSCSRRWPAATAAACGR